MINRCTFILILSLLLVSSYGQQKKTFLFASRPYRDSITEQLKKTIHQTLRLPLKDSTYSKWTGVFWAMELMLYKPESYERLIPKQLEKLPQTDPAFQRSFLEMLYTLYPKKHATNLTKIWQQLKTEKVKVMALEYMAQSGIFYNPLEGDSFVESDYYRLFKKRWPAVKLKKPSKNDFLSTSIFPGESLLCSFQSSNRDLAGYLMIRKADGAWLKDNTGKPFRFKQLARSITSLPYYITNGNTPQGLYKLNGFDSSSNSWIGPTTNLQMVMPFENGAASFFGTDTLFADSYSLLLGSLANCAALWESYEAGKIGRSEIIAHGTTIDPSFYQNQKYFPCTPSLGCLCSPEVWNEKGELEESVQENWIRELKKLDKMPLYLIVAEVEDFLFDY